MPITISAQARSIYKNERDVFVKKMAKAILWSVANG